VLELGGLFWAKAVLEMQSTAPIAVAIEKCFMPNFPYLNRRRDAHGLSKAGKRTLASLLDNLFSM
jgi:hypothetical protein